MTGTREQRRRLLPARLVVYFVLALVAVPGPELRLRAGDGQAGGRAVPPAARRGPAGRAARPGRLGRCRGRAGGGGRRTSPSCRAGAGKLGPDPVHMLFEQVAGPRRRTGRRGCSAAGCGWCRWTARPPTCRTARRTSSSSGGRRTSPGWGVPAGPVGGRGRVGDRGLIGATIGPYTAEQTLARGPAAPASGRGCWCWPTATSCPAPWPATCWPPGRTSCGGPRRLSAEPGAGAGRWQLPGGTAPAPQGRRAAHHGAGHRVHRAHHHRKRGVEDSSELFCLVTDLLDPEAYPVLDLACCYPERWGCETVIGHHKTDMGEGMAVLRSKDPEGVDPGDVGVVRGLPGHPHPDRRRRRRHRHPTGQGSASRTPWPPRPTPSRLFPLMSLTWPWPPSCSRSSTRDSSSATARTGPAPADQESRRLPRPKARPQLGPELAFATATTLMSSYASRRIANASENVSSWSTMATVITMTAELPDQ